MSTEKKDYQKKEDFYTCRKCGTQLFTKPDVLHENHFATKTIPSNMSTIKPTSSVSNVKTAWGGVETNGQSESVCTSVFITEPPPWMSNAESHDGRLDCPKCKCRVGFFSWSGVTCSCGRWITPAFQFQLSRIDVKKAINSTSLIDLRMAQPIGQPLPSKSQ